MLDRTDGRSGALMYRLIALGIYPPQSAGAKYLMQSPSPSPRSKVQALVEIRRRTHPHTVRQRGLLRSRIDEDEFLTKLDERRRWLDENCRGSFWVDDLLEADEVTGKLYRFAEIHDADWFRYRF